MLVGCNISTSAEPEIVSTRVFGPAVTPTPRGTLPAESVTDPTPAATEEPADTSSGQTAVLATPQTTEEPSAATPTAPVLQIESSADLTVSITNGTAGASTPVGLEVILTSLEVTEDDITPLYRESRIAENNQYQFEDVPLTAQTALTLETTYQGVDYIGIIEAASLTADDRQLQLQVFEATSDPEVIRIDRAWYIIDAVSPNGQAQVLSFYFYRNASDRVYIEEFADTITGIQIPLPEGTQNTQIVSQSQIAGQDRFELQTDTGQEVLIDRKTLFPNEEGQIQVGYFLPYTDTLNISRRLPYPAESIVVYTPEARGLVLEGENFEASGIRDIRGLGSHDSYTHPPLAANEEFSFSIRVVEATNDTSAAPVARTNNEDESNLFGENTAVILGAGLFLVMLSAVYMIIDLQRQRTRAKGAGATAALTDKHSRNREELIEAIAVLDDAFEGGMLSEDEYLTEREILKRQLRTLMLE